MFIYQRFVRGPLSVVGSVQGKYTFAVSCLQKKMHLFLAVHEDCLQRKTQEIIDPQITLLTRCSFLVILILDPTGALNRYYCCLSILVELEKYWKACLSQNL